MADPGRFDADPDTNGNDAETDPAPDPDPNFAFLVKRLKTKMKPIFNKFGKKNEQNETSNKNVANKWGGCQFCQNLGQ